MIRAAPASDTCSLRYGWKRFALKLPPAFERSCDLFLASTRRRVIYGVNKELVMRRRLVDGIGACGPHMNRMTTRARFLVAVAVGTCLGIPIRAWSTPDPNLCSGQGTTRSQYADLQLTSMSVDGVAQPVPSDDAGTAGSIGSPDETGATNAILPGLVPDAGIRVVHVRRGSL